MASVGLDGSIASGREAPLLRELGRYRLLALVGQGGMGDIYLAMATGPSGWKKLVVVKCLRNGSEEDLPMRAMFLDEGQLAARLNHPHVVQTYEVGEAGGLHYMAMEYLDGQPLSRIRRAPSPMDPRIAARIACDALAGLHYAHELCDFDGTPLGIVHRDLSPPNIFVTYDGVVKLVDFGIAKTALASRAMTEVGVLMGKLGYMAPEHVSRIPVDRRADIFAMGIVLWELLTHTRLVTDKSPVAALQFLLHGTFPQVSAVRPGIDPDLDRIVACALEKRPDARYPTAFEMRAELESYLARSGGAVRDEDLGRLVNDRFSGARERRGRQLKEWVAAADAGALPVVSAPRESSASNSDARALGTVPENRLSLGPLARSGGSIEPHTDDRPAPRSRSRLALSSAWARSSTPVRALSAVLLGLVLWGGLLIARPHRAVLDQATVAATGTVSTAPAVAPAPAVPSVDPRPAGERLAGENESGGAALPADPKPRAAFALPAAQKPRVAPSRESRSRGWLPRPIRTHPAPASSAAVAVSAPPAAAPASPVAESIEPAAHPPAAAEVKKRVRLVEDQPQVDLVE